MRTVLMAAYTCFPVDSVDHGNGPAFLCVDGGMDLPSYGQCRWGHGPTLPRMEGMVRKDLASCGRGGWWHGAACVLEGVYGGMDLLAWGGGDWWKGLASLWMGWMVAWTCHALDSGMDLPSCGWCAWWHGPAFLWMM